MSGPYTSEAQAACEPMPRAIRDLHDTGRIRSGDPDRLRATTVMNHTADALTAIGVELGAFDRRIVTWMCSTWEPTAVQVVLGLVSRAHVAGRRSSAR